MTHNPPPPKIALIPENAPFTPEQRAWLDGFFIAALGLAALIGLAVAIAVLGWLSLTQIEGQTGDVLGAVEQTGEIVVLLIALI